MRTVALFFALALMTSTLAMASFTTFSGDLKDGSKRGTTLGDEARLVESLTAPSPFTAMDAKAMEAEPERGELTGLCFGCSLMTSGSFTMMAASGFEE